MAAKIQQIFFINKQYLLIFTQLLMQKSILQLTYILHIVLYFQLPEFIFTIIKVSWWIVCGIM